LTYQHDFGPKHHIGIRHTLAKSKADLDANIYYRYGDFNKGMLELNLVMLDWASNIIEGLVDDSRSKYYSDRYDVTHYYRTFPRLFTFKIVSSKSKRLHIELLGGLQTYSKKEVERHIDTLNFVDQEWAHYAGGLLEYTGNYFTTGLTYQRTFSKLKRAPAPNSNFDLKYGNWEILNSIGYYATTNIFHPLRLEQWVWYEYNIDRMQGEKVPGDLSPLGFKRIPFHYNEKRVKLKSRILLDPKNSGLKMGLEFHADYIYPQGEKASNGIRNYDFRNVYPIVRNRNDRLTYTVGYRFNQKVYLLVGFSYDLDKDKQSGIGLPRITGTPTWFDGGFGRFTISW